MSNLAKLEFLAFDISGQNYLSWVLNAEIYLAANGPGDTIQADKETTVEQKVKAMIFLRHHLHENLKIEYLTIKDRLVLWNHLKDMYEHQKAVILLRAHYDWVHLRFQDFKTVSGYNSAMFRITSQLTLCEEKITDEEMLEKTFSTFHAFKKYCDLISCLLVAEQNNELLIKIHESRPTGSAPLSKANVVTYNQSGGRGRGSDSGRGRGRGGGRGQGRGFGRGVIENGCYRCGNVNHWARACRTPKHLVELYQRSQKSKGKGVEVNLAYQNDKNDSFDIDSFGIDSLSVDNLGVPKDQNDTTHLDVSDFLTNTSREVTKAVECLKKEFEMKDLGKTKFCLGLQIDLKNGILVHQNAYIDKLLRRFYMDKSHPLSIPMVVRTLDVEKGPFRSPNGDEEIPDIARAQQGDIGIGRGASTVVHEDNAACIAQLKDRYIKGDRIKHILSKFFFTHDLQNSGDIIVQKVRSSDNLADLFTKTLSTATFKKLVHNIGMRRLYELK
ncbi:uncharacterized protein Tco_0019919 [Tanacetum coccineum]